MSIKRFKKILFILFTAFISMQGQGAVSFDTDSDTIEYRSMDRSEMSSYKKDRNFKYKDTGSSDGDSIWDRISYYLARLFGRALDSHVGSVSVWELILYAAMIFGVLMIIMQFLKIRPQSIVSRSSQSLTSLSIETGDIHDIDFDRLIQQSSDQHNYRLAVRFWYLKMLKMLSDAHYINWQINKTNHDYYYEIKQQLRSDFLSLTDTFEDSWYGNHNPDSESYQRTVDSFRSFFNRLK